MYVRPLKQRNYFSHFSLLAIIDFNTTFTLKLVQVVLTVLNKKHIYINL